MSKPGLPQGTRDFGPETVHKRNFIFDTIRSVFEVYGYEPLETPAMENLDTLLGKYGEEGDKLIFKILNNGLDHDSKKESARAAFENILSGKNDKNLTERALRYDLTIPFARYVATNHNALVLPFRRYQMQPVWRADRPQKGRYREFYQCDADVVGSASLFNEVELAGIYLTVFEKLGIAVELCINHRKILAGLAVAAGGAENTTAITTAIDKLDKIGMEKVKEELAGKNINAAAISVIEKYLQIEGTSEEKIKQLSALLPNEFTRSGVKDLQFILQYIGNWNSRNNISAKNQGPEKKSFDSKNQDTEKNSTSVKNQEAEKKSFDSKNQDTEKKSASSNSSVLLDFSLARGLNYYTGTIFEVRAKGVQMGSIGGGGRYDDLTGLFGVPGIPGVGISFGIDRIYDVMEELKMFPKTVQRSTEVLFFNLGITAAEKSFELMQGLREQGIRCELFHEQAKFDKQFKYAEKKNIPAVVIIGEDELKSGVAKIKNLGTGIQQEVPFSDLGAKLRN